MAKQQTFLQLTPEFGGTTFGPFVGTEYRLGTAEDNHVQLAEGLGVDPHHARLLRKSDDTFLLAPVERTSAVWLHRAGAGEPTLLRSPAVVMAGDSFALVTPDGVRFEIVHKQVERPKARGGVGAGGAGVGDRMKRGLVSEVRRRLYATALTSYFGQMAQRTWFFVKTGQIFSPVYLIGALTMMSGFGVGGYQCRQKNAARAAHQTAARQAETCEEELAIAQGGLGAERTDLPVLVARITGDRTWEASLEWSPLRRRMTTEMRRVFLAPDSGEGALDDRWFASDKSPYARVRARLGSNGGLEPPLAATVAWTAIEPFTAPDQASSTRDRWSRRVGSDGDALCVRGLLRLSYPQAVAAGLDAVEDALVGRDDIQRILEASRDEQQREATVRFRQIRDRAAQDADPSGAGKWTFDRAVLPSQELCLVAGRPGVRDARSDLPTSAAALGQLLSAGDLPGVDRTNWISGRIARLYDLDDNRPDAPPAPAITATPLSSVYAGLTEQDAAQARWIAEHTGEVLGRAVAIPCRLRLERGPDEPLPDHLLPGADPSYPRFEDCAVLAAVVTWED